MKARREWLIWALAFVFFASAARQFGHVEPGSFQAAGAAPLLKAPVLISEDSLNDLSDRIAEEGVFRMSRTAGQASSATPGTSLAAPQFAVRPARPTLMLKAIIGGPPWQGIVEGFPGHDGALVVQAGDSVNAFKVRAVGRDTVVIQSRDTTYRLVLRNEP